MSHKPNYKNINTGNYGVIEGGAVSIIDKRSEAYLSLRLFVAVGDMVELSFTEEKVLPRDLVEVSPEEVQRVLLGF